MKDMNEIIKAAEDFIAHNPVNEDKELGIKIYDLPIFGIASADDPLFMRLKEPGVVGPHCLSPQEWLPGAKTVIAYFLPFTEEIRKANRTERWPALEWLHGRYEGEICNEALRRFLRDEFIQACMEAVAPTVDPRFKIFGYSSNWSERHAAFIAGLGTFSLSKSMITKKGCAGRYGSVIVNQYFAPTLRPYREIDEYCSKCGTCIKRCPVDAISISGGKKHEPCDYYINKEVFPETKPRYGCGKCQTAVPCEFSIPQKPAK